MREDGFGNWLVGTVKIVWYVALSLGLWWLMLTVIDRGARAIGIL